MPVVLAELDGAGQPAVRARDVVAAGGRSAGNVLGGVFPQLLGTSVADLQLAETVPETFAGCQVIFSATPQGVSLDVLPDLVAEHGVTIVFTAACAMVASSRIRPIQTLPCRSAIGA